MALLRRAVALAVAAGAALPSSAALAQPPAPPEAPPPSQDADVAALREEVRALRAEIHPPAPPPRPLGYEPFWPWVLPPEGIATSGYVQAQYESHDDSQAQLAQNGSTLNYDRWSIRRARVSLTGEWTYAAAALELDANTTNGPQVDLRKAEASLQYRPDRARPPMAMLTFGLFDAPFGYELVESPRTRWFTERTVASRAFYPAEPDLGVRVAGALGFFRWTIAAQNGEPLGEASPYVLQNPKKSQDVVFRFGFDTTPFEKLHLAGEVSALRGQGFHAGTSATKGSLQWNDVNEDGTIQPYELVPVPGAAAIPSQNFDHWAVGAGVRAHYDWWLGVLKVYGEVVLAQNLDRGLYVADPVVTGVDQRELGWYVAALQQVTRWGVVGLRYESYDPNSDAFDKRGGKLIPFSEAITTWSPLVGVTWQERARLVLQYDAIHNALGRAPNGVPTNLKDNVWTLRLQVNL